MTNFDNYEALKECIWTKPDDYAGYNPEGEAVIAGRSRDSSLLEESNWDAMKEIAGDGDYVYDWRAHHWAVGWVEYLMLKPDAPDEVKKRVDEALCALADYPVLDEEDLSRRELEAAEELWGTDISHRLSHIHDFNTYYMNVRNDQKVPFLAARRSLRELSESYHDFYMWIYEMARE